MENGCDTCIMTCYCCSMRNKAKEKWKTSSNQGKVTTTDKVSRDRWVTELILLIFSLYPSRILTSGIKPSMSDLEI